MLMHPAPLRPKPPGEIPTDRLSQFMDAHDLSNDEAGALFGVDRRTIARWVKAERNEQQGASPMTDSARLLLGAYKSGVETPRFKLVLWVREIRREPRKYLPFEGEETWCLLPAEVISSVRIGPFVEIKPLSPLIFGIRWFVERLAGLEALSAEGSLEDSEVRRLDRIVKRYRKFIADHYAANPVSKRGPVKGSTKAKKQV